MGDGAFEEDDQLRSGCADVEEADAELALVGGERGFRRGQGFEDGLGDFEAGFVHAGDDALLRAGRAGGDVQVDFQPIADHPHGVMNAGLLVEDELLGQQVEDFAIGRQGDGAGAIDGGADIVFGDFAQAGAEADAAAAVDAADVGSADGDDEAFNDGLRGVFGHHGRAIDGHGCGREVGDESLAHAGGVADAMAAITQRALVHLSDEHADFRTARVEDGDDVVLLSHAAPGLVWGGGDPCVLTGGVW